MGKLMKLSTWSEKRFAPEDRLSIDLGESLADVIARSRQIKPVCPFILHRMPQKKFKGNLDHWAMITPDHLSKTFSKVRDGIGLFQHMDKRERPTFHEIRGLGGNKLYLDAGYSDDFVNKLMGHTTQKMTDNYTDPHQQWTDVRADLKIGVDDE